MAEPFVSQSMIITMRCVKTNVAMAVEDDINKVYGLQFHPDSFLTPHGKYLIKKILSNYLSSILFGDTRASLQPLDYLAKSQILS